MVINVTKKAIIVRMASVDDYALPPDVTQAYVKAPRSEEKKPSKFVTDGKWKDYTPPPMPEKK
jgi:ribonuclease Z